jgi:membrane fusion protein, multidrug efflux system
MRRRFILPVIVLVIVTAAAAGGGYWWLVGRFWESTDNAYVQGDIAVMSPKIAGYIAEVPVADNQSVHLGQILVKLDDRDYQAKVAEAKATVEAAAAAVVSNQTKLELQSMMIDQTLAAADKADADEKMARQDFARVKSLLSSGAVSKQQYDAANATMAGANAEMARATAAVSADRQQVLVLKAAGQELLARQHQAEAALALAQQDLEATIIRSPIDGVIGNKGARVGEYVKAGNQLLSVVPIRQLYVVANFKETQLSRMHPGQRAELSIDAFPGIKIEGEIESFAPASGAEFSLLPAENATGNFTKVVQRVPVRISLNPDNPLSGMLRPGLSVVVSINTHDWQPPALAEGTLGAAAAAESTAKPAQ